MVMLREAGGQRTARTNQIWEQNRQPESSFDGAFAWMAARSALIRGLIGLGSQSDVAPPRDLGHFYNPIERYIGLAIGSAH